VTPPLREGHKAWRKGVLTSASKDLSFGVSMLNRAIWLGEKHGPRSKEFYKTNLLLVWDTIQKARETLGPLVSDLTNQERR